MILVQKRHLPENVSSVRIRGLKLQLRNPGAVSYTAVQDDLSGNYVETGKRTPIRFRLVDPLSAPSPEQLRYRLTDYAGKIVREETAAYDPETCVVSIPAPAETVY